MGDELTNAALIGLIGMFGIALVMRAAGSVTAFLTGLPQPDAGPAAGLGVLFNPADPATALGAEGLNPIIYWLVSAVMLGGLAAGIVWVWIRLRHHTSCGLLCIRRRAGSGAGAAGLLERGWAALPRASGSLHEPLPWRAGSQSGGTWRQRQQQRQRQRW